MMDHEKTFEIGGGYLNKRTEELARLRMATKSMPERFEYRVRFPPIGEVIEVDAVKIPLALVPLLRWKRGKMRLRPAKRMPARVTSRMWCPPFDKPVWWKRPRGIAWPIDITGHRLRQDESSDLGNPRESSGLKIPLEMIALEQRSIGG